MQSLARILLPVDFSERSLGAARYARSLASHFGSELILLHVLPPPDYEFNTLDTGGSLLAELYRNRAQQVARELDSFLSLELSGLNVRRLVLEGEPAGKIVAFAHDESVGLIMMPTHGFGPFRRFILGSNTAKVLHDADCPVWTGVHIDQTPSSPMVPLRNILCAVDLGPQSSKTFCWAALLAQEFGAQLTVVHATSASEPGDSPDPASSSLRQAAEAELRRLQQFVHADADLTVETGEPARIICSTAERLAADLLVIGRGSAAGVFGRLRTNAYAIIRESPCPVVSV